MMGVQPGSDRLILGALSVWESDLPKSGLTVSDAGLCGGELVVVGNSSMQPGSDHYRAGSFIRLGRLTYRSLDSPFWCLCGVQSVVGGFCGMLPGSDHDGYATGQ